MADESEQEPEAERQTAKDEEALVAQNRKLIEVISWRFITEVWRRYPKRFDLIEAHPCSGQYDCLVLLTKPPDPTCAIDVNRAGSVHVHQDAFGLGGGMPMHSDWLGRMLGPSSRELLDDIAREAGLTVPEKLPASTPATLTYRYIANFLAHSLGRFEKWECRNGFDDTSGWGGGVRQAYFDAFPLLAKEDILNHGSPLYGSHAYNFWFLLKDEKPMLCLDTSGRLFRRDGTLHKLPALYKRTRRIWPLIAVVDLLWTKNRVG